jgi:transposase
MQNSTERGTHNEHQVYRPGRSQRNISIAVMNGEGKLVMESIIETKAITILQFIQGLGGDWHVTLEEGTWAAWWYDLLKPHVTELVVCDPRKNALMKQGHKSDKIDARKLADLLRGGYLCSVYHGENGLRTVKELARSYLTISKDLSRVMNRVKALYRSWGILCGGQQVYAPRHRSEWLNKIGEAGVRRRAEFFYQQLDALRALRQTVRRDLLAESRKHSATKLLRQIPYIGPIRAAQLLLQLLITLGNAFLVGVVGVHFLFHQEQQLRSPVALQALSNLLRAGLYAPIPEFRQFLGITFPAHYGAHNQLPSQPAQVADHIGQLHIHLRQGFLHPLNAARRRLHMFGSLPPIRP